VAVVCCAVVAQAVNIETVPVGNPGNAGEQSRLLAGDTNYYGGVPYNYRIGKYEVTAGQYTAFLNAVGGEDTNGLYNSEMWNPSYGSGITRSGYGFGSSPFTYTVAADFVNRPVDFVSFWDACRFANWLHNGQPSGKQVVGTTETGAYTLNGMNNDAIVRNADWRWAVTSEDEWYKAAYYKGGGTNAGYWKYSTSSNTAPGQDMADVSGNNVNYYAAPYVYPIDSGKCTTLVGEFQNSASPYGTFDQGGNVLEWNETVYDNNGYVRVMRGGSFRINAMAGISAFDRFNDTIWTEHGEYKGFRVVNVLPTQIVELAWNRDVPVRITEVVDRFGHRSYPEDATQTMPAATTTPEFRQEVLQRVRQMFTDSGVQNVLVTDTPSPGAAMVYFTNPTAGGLDGKAYTGVDQFNKDLGGAAAVFLKHAGQADYGEYNAETVAHEVGHLFGLRHVDPSSTADPNDLEVMDYDNHPGDRERFINTISTTFDGDGVTHNPVYHSRRYIDMLSDGTLVGQGINPGTWDVTIGIQGQTTKIEFDASEKTLFDAYLFGGVGDADSLLTLRHFDAVTLSELAQLEFLLPEGSALRLVAASTLGGELDITLATGNPYDADSVFIDATIGQVSAYLQEWSDTGPGYFTLTNATLTSTLVPEPSTLVLLGIGAVSLLAYAWRRRKWTV